MTPPAISIGVPPPDSGKRLGLSCVWLITSFLMQSKHQKAIFHHTWNRTNKNHHLTIRVTLCPALDLNQRKHRLNAFRNNCTINTNFTWRVPSVGAQATVDPKTRTGWCELRCIGRRPKTRTGPPQQRRLLKWTVLPAVKWLKSERLGEDSWLKLGNQRGMHFGGWICSFQIFHCMLLISYTLMAKMLQEHINARKEATTEKQTNKWK